MIGDTEARAMLKNVTELPSVEACDALREWLRNTIAVIDAQISEGTENVYGWRKRATMARASLYAQQSAVNLRRDYLNDMAKEERIKARNDVDRVRASLFIRTAKKILPAAEYMRIWDAVNDAMKEAAP